MALSSPSISLACLLASVEVVAVKRRDYASFISNACTKFKRLFKSAAGQKQGVFVNFFALWCSVRATGRRALPWLFSAERRCLPLQRHELAKRRCKSRQHYRRWLNKKQSRLPGEADGFAWQTIRGSQEGNLTNENLTHRTLRFQGARLGSFAAQMGDCLCTVCHGKSGPSGPAIPDTPKLLPIAAINSHERRYFSVRQRRIFARSLRKFDAAISRRDLPDLDSV